MYRFMYSVRLKRCLFQLKDKNFLWKVFLSFFRCLNSHTTDPKAYSHHSCMTSDLVRNSLFTLFKSCLPKSDELLALELGDLSELGFNLDLTGFDSSELDKLLSNLDAEGLTDEDDVPETPIEPITKAGDVWILGDHKLICGDSLDEKVLDILLGSHLVDMVFSDPPYNVNYGATAKDKMRSKGGSLAGRKIMNDNLR